MQRKLTLGSLCTWGGEGRDRTPKLLLLAGPCALLQPSLRCHGSPSLTAHSPHWAASISLPLPLPLGLWPSQAAGGLRLGLVVLRALRPHHLTAPRPGEPLLFVSVCLSLSPSLCQTLWWQLGPLGTS